MISTDLIDKLIIGRIDPHIYAFSTNTVPNYLKVGDTYRPVNVRLDEWRTIFPELQHDDNWEWAAKTKNGKYFRDFAVHYYLEQIKHLHRLQPNDIPNIPYYSKEFFEKATPKDIDEAIMDIERCAALADSLRYQFYSEERLPIETHFERTEDYPLRPNQEDAVNAFNAARRNGHRNLLMYAVMRFGKSFTSMYCATEMKAKVVLIVSAKADVRTEWQKTVESHKHFAKYDFLDSAALLADKKAIAKRLDARKRVAIFLTLQDLMGADIKTKHKELFKTPIDLLIVDETHFGARASEYGRILRDSQLNDKQIKKERQLADESFDDLDVGLEQIKKLRVDTTLHLSGTPYRILMGSEFKREDIIAFCQFTDIIDAKEKWDRDNLSDESVNEWENPYYGFPQMIRFAFNPNKSAQQLIMRLLEEGKTTALNELFRPLSITFDSENHGHRLFVHEKEVLDLLRIIDGSAEDDNILSFLDYDKLKDGKMCRHMVFVLPFCASCDAMQALLTKHAREFKNLNEYAIVNIAGVENRYGSTDEVKQHITELEQQGKKSITLTVNRMLTGSTVREWDTMLFLKDVSSPQEYDQAIFRLQNQYVTTYRDEAGAAMKYDMKPQTLLVDFDPNRMFIMQEQKSKIYNVNTNERGNEELVQRIKRELQVSPIIVVNKDRLVEVTPTNIMDAVRDYSATRTVMEEAGAIPLDMDIVQDPGLWDDLKDINPIDASRGIAVKPVEGEGEDYDEPIDGGATSGGGDGSTINVKNVDTEQRDKRLSTLFALVLFYALLTESRVSSLREVLESVQQNKDNQRILRNLGVKFHTLIYLRNNLNPFVLSDLDYKIQTSNQLLNDETFSPQERVERALQKFGRMSESEIVTPAHIADQMVALLPTMGKSDLILDIASKQGEFACAIYRRYGEAILNNVYSIPTSTIAYEFTRKVYSLLGMPIKNIFSTFTSYNLVKEEKDLYINIIRDMNFSAIVGNPPYQDMLDDQRGLSSQLFPAFIQLSIALNPKDAALITPSRWFTGDAQDGSFIKLRDFVRANNHFKEVSHYVNSKEVFPNVELAGGVNYYLWSKDYNGLVNFTTTVNGSTTGKKRKLFEDDLFIILSDGRLYEIIKKVKAIAGFKSVMDITTGRDAFGITGKKEKVLAISKANPFPGSIELFCAHEEIRYIKRDSVQRMKVLVDKWKVFTSKGNGGAGVLDESKASNIIGKAYIGAPGSVCTDSMLPFGSFDTKEEALALQKYMKTKFYRFMVGILKTSQNLYQIVYQFVPVQNFTVKSDIDWSKSVKEIDQQLYAKYKLDTDEIAFIEKMIKPME